MLTALRVRNVAIIESLTLPLAPGFNVLSGETGAGKSIIVGALGLLLGERASSDVIRPGTDRATVEGEFQVGPRSEIAAHLDAMGIDVDDGRVVLKREIAATGRTRAWTNGTPVTAGALAETGRLLVSLHGQHEAQTLVDPDSQRRVLDAYGGALALVERVERAHAELRAVREERTTLVARRTAADRQADYWRHVAREIEEARLVPGEDAALEDEARRLEHAEELRSLATDAGVAIEADAGAALAQLAVAQRALAALQRIDPALARLQELYDAGYYALAELARELAAYAQGIELDPERLAEVERRRDVVIALLRKYGGSLDAVIETGRRARAELDLIDASGIDLLALERREGAAQAELVAAADALTHARTAAAGRLAAAVDAMLPELGMPEGRFVVALERRSEPTATGAEAIEFRVALNRGYPERPLARVASGGELSRVMLCLSTILAGVERLPTLVFDEVDAGIGGRVGLEVGDTLRRVAQHHQVFAITHLPQIAARAHHHILVSKGGAGGVTTADVQVLDGAARVREIARMLGGDPERSVSREHARELLERAVASGGRLRRRGRGVPASE